MRGAGVVSCVRACLVLLALLLAGAQAPAAQSEAERAFQRGYAAKERGDLDAALAAYTEAVRLDPNSAKSFNNRGIVLKEKGETDRALADYDSAIRVDPRHAKAFYNRGVLNRDRREPAKALADLDESIRLDPTFANAFAHRSGLYRERGDLDRALADADEAVRLDPNGVRGLFARGLVRHAKGDRDGAIADYTATLRLDPKNANAAYDRGLLRKDKGDLDGAVADYTEALRLDPTYAKAFYNRGIARNLKGDRAGAIADYAEVLRLDPGFANAYRNRGYLLRDAGDPAGAARDFADALRLNPALGRDPAFLRARSELSSGGTAPAVPPRSGTSASVSASVASAAASVLAASEGVARLSARPAQPAPAAPPAAILPPETRVALVVGNGAYASVGRLDNPLRDAATVAQALREAGFRTVHLKSDLGYDALRRALADFSTEAEQADWALVYYAGHGMEMGGVNYLVPVDARLKSDRAVAFETVPLDQVLASIEGARKLRLVILDACRDNPFLAQMTRSVASRGIGRGLAQVEPQVGGTLVAYAAKAGQTALDGAAGARNSPFVAALTRNIGRPGIEIRRLFGLVRDDVLAETGRKQEPFVYGSLGGDEYFFRAPGSAPPAQPVR
ncbi:tetratricopeptide repeat protein [Methylobacterium sp. sgz302541]|uniref:tetratricopeptide repeat protein n=1 Tax=unclassified Methylobacterium TaxID=2615210 RepID=UPI003D34461A